ncbi:uncharacterized protein BJX67DRAFT_379035 [Aspergillus lucknowensis]|uniref:RING-type domain-containing protein n=1 Tax=Aspergillus lucknowensis TaxID=176173 RepID=A0ABR4LY76_9EURO
MSVFHFDARSYRPPDENPQGTCRDSDTISIDLERPEHPVSFNRSPASTPVSRPVQLDPYPLSTQTESGMVNNPPLFRPAIPLAKKAFYGRDRWRSCTDGSSMARDNPNRSPTPKRRTPEPDSTNDERLQRLEQAIKHDYPARTDLLELVHSIKLDPKPEREEPHAISSSKSYLDLISGRESAIYTDSSSSPSAAPPNELTLPQSKAPPPMSLQSDPPRDNASEEQKSITKLFKSPAQSETAGTSASWQTAPSSETARAARLADAAPQHYQAALSIEWSGQSQADHSWGRPSSKMRPARSHPEEQETQRHSKSRPFPPPEIQKTKPTTVTSRPESTASCPVRPSDLLNPASPRAKDERQVSDSFVMSQDASAPSGSPGLPTSSPEELSEWHRVGRPDPAADMMPGALLRPFGSDSSFPDFIPPPPHNTALGESSEPQGRTASPSLSREATIPKPTDEHFDREELYFLKLPVWSKSGMRYIVRLPSGHCRFCSRPLSETHFSPLEEPFSLEDGEHSTYSRVTPHRTRGPVFWSLKSMGVNYDPSIASCARCSTVFHSQCIEGLIRNERGNHRRPACPSCKDIWN